jgi:hypothetical protein
LWQEAQLRETVWRCSQLKIRPAAHSGDKIVVMKESFWCCFNRGWKNILLSMAREEGAAFSYLNTSLLIGPTFIPECWPLTFREKRKNENLRLLKYWPNPQGISQTYCKFHKNTKKNKQFFKIMLKHFFINKMQFFVRIRSYATSRNLSLF